MNAVYESWTRECIKKSIYCNSWQYMLFRVKETWNMIRRHVLQTFKNGNAYSVYHCTRLLEGTAHQEIHLDKIFHTTPSPISNPSYSPAYPLPHTHLYTWQHSAPPSKTFKRRLRPATLRPAPTVASPPPPSLSPSQSRSCFWARGLRTDATLSGLSIRLHPYLC